MSSGWKIFLTVVVVLVVIGLLIGGGYGLYRLGFVQGIAAAAAAGDSDQLPRIYGWGMHGYYDGDRMPMWRYGGMMSYGGHMPYGMFGFGGWFGGLLLLAGVIALVVLAVNAFTRKQSTEQSGPTLATPAPLEPTAAKRTRNAKRA